MFCFCHSTTAALSQKNAFWFVTRLTDIFFSWPIKSLRCCVEKPCKLFAPLTLAGPCQAPPSGAGHRGEEDHQQRSTHLRQLRWACPLLARPLPPPRAPRRSQLSPRPRSDGRRPCPSCRSPAASLHGGARRVPNCRRARNRTEEVEPASSRCLLAGRETRACRESDRRDSSPDEPRRVLVSGRRTPRLLGPGF